MRSSWDPDSHTRPIGFCITSHIISSVLTRAKKWGNSIGLVIPMEVVRKERIRPGDAVDIVVHRRTPTIEELGGTVKLRHNLRDLLRLMEEGWDDL